MIFVVAFLGALFAILTSLLVVYTWVTLYLIPRLKKSFRTYVGEIGPKAIFERAGLTPEEVMRDAGLDPIAAHAAAARARGSAPSGIHVVFTCEDHGRCAGCPRVLAQFEAIVTHQGAESFDEVERTCHDQLREKFAPQIAEEKAIGSWIVGQLAKDGVDADLALAAATAVKPTATYADVKDLTAAWYVAALNYCRKWRAWARLGVDEDAAAEGEVSRQRQLAVRLVETLVREGAAISAARGAVWSCTAAQRSTFASWIDAARVRLDSEDERRAGSDA